MIDLHSHVLAGVDDGSANIEKSLKILKDMESRGVKKACRILSLSTLSYKRLPEFYLS